MARELPFLVAVVNFCLAKNSNVGFREFNQNIYCSRRFYDAKGIERKLVDCFL